MATIDPANTTLLVEAERWHAAALREVLVRVFEADPNLADEYLEALATSSPEERLLALHDDPLDIATTITGFSLNQDRASVYSEFVKEIESGSLEQRPKTLHPVRPENLDRALQELGYERIQSGLGRPYNMWARTDFAAGPLPEILTFSVPQFRAEGIAGPVYDRYDVLDFLTHVAAKVPEDIRGEAGRNLLEILGKVAQG